jgi:hypothetical protein
MTHTVKLYFHFRHLGLRPDRAWLFAMLTRSGQ